MRRVAWVLAGLAACVAPPLPPEPPARASVEAPPLPPAESSSRRAALAVQVPSVPEALRRLEEALATRGGYQTQREFPEERTDGRVAAVISFQVDLRQAGFVETLLDQSGTRLAMRQEVADATAPMIEANARLASLRETEARIRGILSDPATTCPERVAAETEHGRVLREMSELAARVKVLEFRSQYAAFSVRLVEPDPPSGEPAGGRSVLARVPAAWTRIVRDPAGSLFDGAVAVLASIPWILAFGIACQGVRRFRRRRLDGREGRPAA
ncbi:DUF4349 domain-containing protein [Myxococcota bacterium]|nr:DUF4349 domain-containing protein [Myxococcota bacterium]